MPPKLKAAAKAKKARARARARKVWLRTSNTRRNERHRAQKALNDLAAEVGATSAQIPVKEAKNAQVERLVRLLEGRVDVPERLERLRVAAKLWSENGGLFSKPLLEEDHGRATNVCRHRVLQPGFELKSKAFMMTYNSSSFAPATWRSFREFVLKLKGKFGARAWSACLEESLHGATSSVAVYHTHSYLLWTDGVGVHSRNLDAFCFEGVRPRIDVCTAHLSTRSPHSAALHGLWYVALMKRGTVEADTNYPAGVWYKPQAQWLQNLYQDHKLTYDEHYIEHSARCFPVGHAARKRDAEEALRDVRQLAVDSLVQRELESLRGSASFSSSRSYPVIDAFVNLFSSSAWRRPLLLIVGATNLGKSMLAAVVLERVAEVLGLVPRSFLEVTVEDDGHLDLSDLDVAKHAGVLLDGGGDVLLLKKARETLQGRPKGQKGGRAQTMRYAYPYTLARRAVVVTMDLSVANLEMLQTDHWLSDARNVMVLRLAEPAWQGQDIPLRPVLRSSQETLCCWSAAEVFGFLKAQDLEGPAGVLFKQGVRGRDFAVVTLGDLVEDLRLSKLASRNVLEARDRYLQTIL